MFELLGEQFAASGLFTGTIVTFLVVRGTRKEIMLENIIALFVENLTTVF